MPLACCGPHLNQSWHHMVAPTDVSRQAPSHEVRKLIMPECQGRRCTRLCITVFCSSTADSCNLSQNVKAQHTLTSEVRDKQGLTGSCSAPSALRACSRGGNTYQSSLTLKHHRKVLNYTCVTSGVWWGAMQCDKYSCAQLGRAHLAGADGNGMLHAVCIAPHDGYMSISKGD